MGQNGKYFAIFSQDLSVIKWHFGHSREYRVDYVAMPRILAVEGQILSTCDTGQKVRTLSDHFRKSKQRQPRKERPRLSWIRERERERERERNKIRSSLYGEKGVRRSKGRTSDEEVRKHLLVPTRFCGSWSSPRELVEAESILRTAGYRYHADWYRSHKERERNRATSSILTEEHDVTWNYPLFQSGRPRNVPVLSSNEKRLRSPCLFQFAGTGSDRLHRWWNKPALFSTSFYRSFLNPDDDYLPSLFLIKARAIPSETACMTESIFSE